MTIANNQPQIKFALFLFLMKRQSGIDLNIALVPILNLI